MPHTSNTSAYHLHTLEIIKKYQITVEEFTNFEIKTIYKRIINTHFSRPQSRTKESWLNLHHNIFPNNIKTFNYKLSWNLLPTKSKYITQPCNPEEKCTFCSLHTESNIHLFHFCHKIKPILNYTNQLFNKFTDLDIDIFENTSHIYLHNLSNIVDPEHKDLYTYLSAITHHKIWKIRNDIAHGDSSLSAENVIQTIKNSILGRKRVERERSDTSYLDFFSKLSDLL